MVTTTKKAILKLIFLLLPMFILYVPGKAHAEPVVDQKTDVYAVAAKEWQALIGPLTDIGPNLVELLPDPGDQQLRYEQYRQLFSMVAAGYWRLLYQNPDNPDFVPFWYNFGAPNPDDAYTATAIRGDGIYKITGYRGSTHIFTISVGSGLFFTRGMGDRMGPNLAEYDVDELQVNDDGWFEVILSAERPKGYTGNWLLLEPEATNILVRQRHYDWRNEEPGRLAIQRLDKPIAQLRQTTEQLQDNLQQIAQWTQSWAKWSVEFANRSRRLGYVNKVEVNGLYDIGGYAIQKYIMGLWDIAPDEALIYETQVPETCRYWAVQLVDEIYATLEHMNLNRQTSINGHSAVLDADGKFRAVISIEDPGVPNWLDAAGYTKGGIFGRWLQCSSYPKPTVTKVKLAELRTLLPVDTAFVSAEQREQQLRARREAYQLRHRWN